MYADVIRQSFATVAKDFNLTLENCPGHTSFISNERLASKIKDGYYPFGYFADGKLVGFASITDISDGVYEMNDIAVLPKYRHFGYGKRLVDFCKEKVKELGGNKIIIGIVEENAVLKDWYAANGFVHTGTKRFEHLPFTVGYMEWEAKNMDNYTDINAKAIDIWVENGWEWGVPISHEVFVDAKNGKWDVVLTPIKPVPHDLFSPFLKNGRLDGVRLLGLASGGGQQMPVFSALGADCTVLDYSDRQLESERIVAERENYKINILKADMTNRFPFEDNSFDIVFHPVSNCYIEDVYHVWNECYRVLRSGGILLAGMDNGFNFIIEDFSVRPLVISNKLPYNPLNNPEQMKHSLNADDTIQFSHTFDEQIGGQLKAGFVITAAYEDFNNEPDAIADGIPAYWATKAVKPPLGW